MRIIRNRACRAARRPAGPRDSDGVWAPHWYAAVEASSGFEPWRPHKVTLAPDLRPLLDACRPWYEKLYAQRLAD